jgi:nucleotide-binding universal stress UspA family protein
MFELKRVLAATDGSEHGACAVVTAANLARRAGARLDLASVVKPSLAAKYKGRERHFEAEGALLQRARRATEAQARQAKAVDPYFHIVAGPPAPTIADLASEFSADVVVVGAHSRSRVQRIFAGSTAERAIRMAPCPVLAAATEQRTRFRRVLAAVDLSPHAHSVIDTASAIARVDGADLVILHVEEPISSILRETAKNEVDAVIRGSHERFERVIRETAGLPGFAALERYGYAGHEILQVACDWLADLVVVGSQGLGLFGRMVLGSTSMYVLRHGRASTILVLGKQEGIQAISCGGKDAG